MSEVMGGAYPNQKPMKSGTPKFKNTLRADIKDSMDKSSKKGKKK